MLCFRPLVYWFALAGPAAARDAPGGDTLSVKLSDFVALADEGVLSGRAEAQRIWLALQARHRRGAREKPSLPEGDAQDGGGVADAVQDLRRLISLTNLLQCIAAVLLSAVFTGWLYILRHAHLAQGAVAVAYAVVFVYWGLKLLAMGSAAESGSPLIGGLLLMVPNVAAMAVGLATIELLMGTKASALYEEWAPTAWREVLVSSKFGVASLIMETAVMICSALLYGLSYFPMLLVPLFASFYLCVVSLCLLLTRSITGAVWGSIGHTLLLLCAAHVAPLTPDLRLGLVISACNSGFWSVPYMLCVLPMGLGTDGSFEHFGTMLGSGLDAVIKTQLWPRPSFVVSLVCYALGNTALLCYGFHASSWVPLPYALFGVVVTMLLANHAPPRMRLAWRLLYNLPIAIVLFAVSCAYDQITDATMLQMLEWVGRPQHFRLIAVFVVRTTILLCANGCLWWGLSRMFWQRLLLDLKDQLLLLEREAADVAKLRETVTRLAESEGPATGSSPWTASWGPWFRRGGQSSAASLAQLREALQASEAREGPRQQHILRMRRWTGRFEASGLAAYGSVPMCWAGYCIVSSMCDAGEPFLLLRVLLNAVAAYYIVRAFGGIVMQVLGLDASVPEKFTYWRAPVSIRAAVPCLLFFGVRVISMAEQSILRHLAGLVLLVAGILGIFRGANPLAATLMGIAVSTCLMAFGILLESGLVVFVGIMSSYCAGLFLLLMQVGQNVMTLACGVTAVALATMHLGMSYETYFVAMEKAAIESLPFVAELRVLATYCDVERRLLQGLVHAVGGLLFLQ